MTAWLVVSLIAPLASFGERAGNAERSTAERPTRSGLLGLAGAALGIRRDDAEGQAALSASFRIASQTVGAGTLLADFHTFQSLPSAKGKPATRAQALAQRRDLATSITRREYRCDVWHEAAYATNADARWSLEDLRAAFLAPRFTLFLGRKSCPLGAPLAPRILEADDLPSVFRQRLGASPYRDRTSRLFDRRGWRHRRGGVAAEQRDDLGQANRMRQRTRQDEPGDRGAWQFTARREYLLPAEDEEGGPS